MKYILFTFILFLAACQDTRVKSPKILDIKGTWETLSVMQILPYGLLEVNEKGEGSLIAVSEEITAEVIRFHSFESRDREFRVVLHFLEDGELDEGAVITGSIDRGQLCFDISEEESEEENNERNWVCFTKHEKVDGFRERAFEYLRNMNKNA